MTDPKPKTTRRMAAAPVPGEPALASIDAADQSLRSLLPDGAAKEKALRKLAAARRAAAAALAGAAVH